MTTLDLVLDLAAEIEWSRIIAHGRCDCGSHVRHRNGGNYHPAAEVIRRGGDYAVSLTSSREFFPGDRWGDCPCGARYLEGEEHFHTSSPNEVAEAILRHLGPQGGALLLLKDDVVIRLIDVPPEE